MYKEGKFPLIYGTPISFFFREARFDILTYITKTQEKRGSLYQRVVSQKLPQQSINKQQKNKEVPTAQEGQNNQLFWGGQRKKKTAQGKLQTAKRNENEKQITTSS
eukprot:TRINITY_DN48152_c0_g1_i1.p2 TRINITY_DN48152_c0_g1~~TRINITY_DN48152_c0_g1_i1.p2  ORF type:complete len:106 (-),score=11.76 TRINITY_DN48152_c0_g1_i1:572-889(-)